MLDCDFASTALDQTDAQDTTDIWTQEGWLYLVTVIDLYGGALYDKAWGQEWPLNLSVMS